MKTEVDIRSEKEDSAKQLCTGERCCCGRVVLVTAKGGGARTGAAASGGERERCSVVGAGCACGVASVETTEDAANFTACRIVYTISNT